MIFYSNPKNKFLYSVNRFRWWNSQVSFSIWAYSTKLL